ncbi:MAG: Uma2 family endonuclease [Clostridiales bacterium]|jgi:Uma2 family endonuclease|nr:Uma2 family endonuclease [Clostridiales bacterium]
MSAARKLEEYYTYEDYAKWETDKRFELIDGVPYAMAAPNTRHQRVSRRLTLRIGNHLEQKKGHSCELFVAPYDVRLNPNTRDDTVFQPDLIVICDPKKIDEKFAKGAPDWVIEILSPSNTHHDRVRKLIKYREARVREIWFVDPETKLIEIYRLEDDGEYSVHYHLGDQSIEVGILPGFAIDTKDIFEEE